MQTRQRVSLFLLSFTLAAANAASAAYPEYRVTVVGPRNSEAVDINQVGVVVGNYLTGPSSYRPFLNRGRGVVMLGTLGGTSSRAVAINDKGVVLGNWGSDEIPNRGFLYYHGRLRDLGTIFAGRPTNYYDINNAGYTIASSTESMFASQRGYLRAPGGGLTDIGHLPYENPLTLPRALNNRNQITGASGPLTFPDQPLRAFLWTRGVMRDLGDFGWEPNYGNAINDRGQVAGTAAIRAVLRSTAAFLYSRGRLIKLDPRPNNVEQHTSGDGINNHGHVVGSSDLLSGYVYRGRRMESLNALINPASGWDIRFPRAINDKGQIAATAYRGGIQYAVRLDLIRPHHLSLPPAEADAEAPLVTEPLSPEAAAADAKAEAEAQARELVQPVQQ